MKVTCRDGLVELAKKIAPKQPTEKLCSDCFVYGHKFIETTTTLDTNRTALCVHCGCKFVDAGSYGLYYSKDIHAAPWERYVVVGEPCWVQVPEIKLITGPK